MKNKLVLALVLCNFLFGCDFMITCIDTKTNKTYDFFGPERKCNKVMQACYSMNGGDNCEKLWKNLEELDTYCKIDDFDKKIGLIAKQLYVSREHKYPNDPKDTTTPLEATLKKSDSAILESLDNKTGLLHGMNVNCIDVAKGILKDKLQSVFANTDRKVSYI